MRDESPTPNQLLVPSYQLFQADHPPHADVVSTLYNASILIPSDLYCRSLMVRKGALWCFPESTPDFILFSIAAAHDHGMLSVGLTRR